MCGPFDNVLQRFGVAVARCTQAKFDGGDFANAVAVHRHDGRAGGRNDGDALRLEIGEDFGADRFHFRYDEIGLMLVDRGGEKVGVQHREYLEPVGDLHRRRACIAVAGDDLRAQPLGRYGEFPAQFAGA